MAMPLTAGQILQERYRIEQILGQGGMGAVYRALDLRLNRACAVKENLDTALDAREQFAREARFLVLLGKHPSLVQVYDFLVEPDGVQYLVMELIEGDDLETLVARQGPLSEAQAIEWMSQVLNAVEYLHANRIIHRDIKPQNIRITPQGKAVLVDFGIAKEYKPRKVTAVGARAVTPGFAPPEQYSGGTDPRSDIYALGATFYFLLTAQVPPEAIERLTNDQRLEPKQFNPTISSQIEPIIQKAMALQPKGRYQSAREMKQALEQAKAPAIVPLAAPSGGLCCHVCGKSARPVARFCSYCGTPLQPPPPPPPRGPGRFTPRPPVSGPLTIPLVCTLEQAKAELFANSRSAQVQNIVNAIRSAGAGAVTQTFMLHGLKGFGGTLLASSIRDALVKSKAANLVAYVILPEQAPADSWAPVLEEILQSLKQGRGNINERLKGVVEKYHRDYVSDRRYLSIEQGKESEVELLLPEVTLFGISLKLGRIKKRSSRSSTPIASPLDERQRGQILLNALKDLIHYLVMQNARVVLIIDKLADIETLRSLQQLMGMPNLFIITIADRMQYDQWKKKSSELLNYFDKTSTYIPCYWEMPRLLCERLTQGRKEADHPVFRQFIKYVEFKGHGLPDSVIRTLTPYYADARSGRWPDWIARMFRATPNTPFLRVPTENQPMIFSYAEMQKWLSEHWAQIFVNPQGTRITWPEYVDMAKVAVHNTLDWLLQEGQRGARHTQQTIRTYATSQCGLLDTHVWVVDNMLTWLQQDGLCRRDTDECFSFTAFLDQRNV
jgi:serine/threonine protein kinase